MSVEEAVAASFEGKNQTGFVYFLASDFPAFRGHFEGYPVLPAVCQVSLCAHAAGQLLGAEVEIAQISRAKFIEPVAAQTRVEVRLTARGADAFLAELINAANGQRISQIIFSVVRKEHL